MSNIVRIITGLFFAVAMVACSMPETRIYSLHMPSGSNKLQQKKQVVISVRVQSPRYLSQPYIAHRLSEYQLDISRYSKWDSAPSEMVKDAFRDSLSSVFQDVRASNFAAEGSYVLAIYLKRFERVQNNQGELMFSAVLSSSEGRELQRYEVEKKLQLESNDTAGLAKSLSGALTDAVREITLSMSKGIQ